MGSSGGKGGSSYEVTDYRMSLHYGVCLGPVDKVLSIRINEKTIGLQEAVQNALDSGLEKTAFSILSENASDDFSAEEVSITAEKTVQDEAPYGRSTAGLPSVLSEEPLVIPIDEPDLFGGPKDGGGIKGQIHFMFGRAQQVMSEFLALKLERTPDTISGYRGLLSVFFTGYELEGFQWSSNVPVLPPVDVTVQRMPRGLEGDDPAIGRDANPAHIIYECLSNRDWGPGYSPESFDEESFKAAAEIYRQEGFGISILWNSSVIIDDFVNEILQHTSSVLRFDLVQEKWELLPLRGGYDIESLPVINMSNSTMKAFQRRGWSEIINQTIVSWKNPESEEEETVTQQSAIGIFFQGGVVSDASGNYPGIRSQDLAWQAAERNLQQLGTPLAMAEFEVSPSVGELRAGDVVWVDWTEEDREGDRFVPPFAARVTKVSRPGRVDTPLKVQISEDIFSYGVTSTESQESAFVNPSQPPADVEELSLFQSPYFAVAQSLGDAEAANLEYPSTRMSILCNSGIADLRSLSLYAYRNVPDVGSQYVLIGTIDETPTAETTSSLSEAVNSTLVVSKIPTEVSVADLLILKSDTQEEICVVESFSGNAVQIRRGVLDTVPKDWPVGSRVFFSKRDASILDETEVLSGSDETYKVLPTTSQGTLNLDDATEYTTTVSDRFYLPLRPARLRVNDLPDFTGQINAVDPSMTLSWASRNRVLETYEILAWDEAGVSAEVGQTTSVSVKRSGVVLFTETGLTSSNTVIDLSGFGLASGDVLVVEAWSERDGFESLERPQVFVQVV